MFEEWTDGSEVDRSVTSRQNVVVPFAVMGGGRGQCGRGCD
jgi:hypothetical protein